MLRRRQSTNITTRPHRRAPRRGTVLLFVLGILAVISLTALSYVTIARLDRQSAAAVANVVNFDQQAQAVLAHIRATLTADLFGNKIVTNSVPRVSTDGNQAQLWPTMFEDGEFRDYPWTRYFDGNGNPTFKDEDPENDPQNSALLEPIGTNGKFEVALADDAWLAPLNPQWDGLPYGSQPYWPQITNLRLAYIYDDNDTPNDTSDDRWVRGDGRFADLGRYFLDPLGGSVSPRRGNPSTDLMSDAAVSIAPSIKPDEAAGTFEFAPFVQINHLDEFDNVTASDPTPQHRDERQWADADGDTYIDSRWQKIDALGSLYGLDWVVATRIIDASALVNYNASLESGYPASLTPGRTAVGRTPADVDLLRLLNEAVRPEAGRYNAGRWNANNWRGGGGVGAQNNFIPQVTATHFDQELRMAAAIRDINAFDNTVNLYNEGTWGWNNNRFEQAQRDAWWTYVGSSPFNPFVSSGGAYPIADIIDLTAFHGLNHYSILSRFEQMADGPENFGYLPSADVINPNVVGPMRAGELTVDSRAFGTNPVPSGLDGLPRQDEVRYSTRRLLTPYSGIGPLSPVPVLNQKAFQAWKVPTGRPYLGQFTQDKISLVNLSAGDLPRVFESLVWALAPLASDEPLTQALADANQFSLLDQSFHYGSQSTGGSAAGPSFGLARALSKDPFNDTVGSPGSAFAVLTAAQMAVNLIDATDTDDVPTVARFLNSGNFDYVNPGTRVGDMWLLGSQFAHGNIDAATNPNLLPTTWAGNRTPGIGTTGGINDLAERNDEVNARAWLDAQNNSGMTIVGLDRHPYLMEVFTAAAYTNVEEETIGGTNLGLPSTPGDNTIDGTDPTNQIGCLIGIQLGNPWGQDLDTTGLQVWLTDEATSNLFPRSQHIVFALPSNDFIPARGTKTYFWVYDKTEGKVLGTLNAAQTGFIQNPNPDAGSTTLLEEMLLVPTLPSLNPMQLLEPADPAALPVIWTGLSGDPTVVLAREIGALGSAVGIASTETPVAVLDRMKQSDTAVEFPAIASNNEVIEDRIINKFGSMSAYLYGLGYPNPLMETFPDDRFNGKAFGGRIIVTSSLSRYSDQPTLGGLPAYMMDLSRYPGPLRGTGLTQDTGQFVHAWLYPPRAGGTDNDTAIVGDEDPMEILDNNGLLAWRLAGDELSSVFADLCDLEQDTTKSAAMEPAGANIPSWQVVLPQRPLEYVSELALISKCAHLCRNHEINDLTSWITAGEQFYQMRRYDGRFGGAANPYIGVLDLSRFVPQSDDGIFGVAEESLSIPLASRVFDCFEALEPQDRLAQGRININTAPERVLQVLPFVTTPQVIPGLNSTIDSNRRVEDIIRYRDAVDAAGNVSPAPGALTNMDGPTTPVIANDTLGLRNGRVAGLPRSGFATAGELAFLDRWTANGGVTSATAGDIGFVGPGADGVPLDGIIDVHDQGIFEPTDDAEERIALYRAVSNIVSSRSDCFIAWFIVRGYDPDEIEVVTLANASQEFALQEFDKLEPAYESRWLAVLDRSNVRKPTDRPRIVLFAELPPATP
ncbi:MAG: hypothetical protein AAFX05_09630 [Planctomycetota bacterium]